MTIDFQAGSSPLASRQNPAVYFAIIAGAAVIAVCFAVRFIQKKRRAVMQTPEWIAAQKNRLTRKSDVQALVRKYNFSEEESALLWYLCAKYKVPNIFFVAKELDAIDREFRKIYAGMREKEESAAVREKFFRLRFKLERISLYSTMISSTTMIPAGSEILYTDGGESVSCTLAENKKDSFTLRIPESLFDSEKRPAELAKSRFSFVAPSGIQYVFETRVIRYSSAGGGRDLILAHTHDIKAPLARRRWKRISAGGKWLFAAVRTETNRKQETVYIPSDKKKECSAVNISGGGCCLATDLPIREGQLIFVEFPMRGQDCSAVGTIVRTSKQLQGGIYNLHIKFVKIDAVTRTRILEEVYGY